MGIFNKFFGLFGRRIDGDLTLDSSKGSWEWSSDERLKRLKAFIRLLKKKEKKLSENEPLFEKIDELERVYNDLLKFYETHNSKYAEDIRNILKVEKLDIKTINKREKEVEPLIEQLEHVHRRISKKPLKLKDRKAVYEALTKPIKKKIKIQGAHRINKEIVIEKKGELILLPGTELYLDKDIGITCKGKLTTKGTKQQPILITASNKEQGWKNIHIKKGKANINYTKISHGTGREHDNELQGGAILISKGSSKININNSIITKNTAKDDGGGIFNEGKLIITNSTISGNTAEFGGGISNLGELIITKKTKIMENTAKEDEGGGILNFAELSITSSTISGNTTEYCGRGICNLGDFSFSLDKDCKIDSIDRLDLSNYKYNNDYKLKHFAKTISRLNNLKDFLTPFIFSYCKYFGGYYDNTEYLGIKPYNENPKKYIKSFADNYLDLMLKPFYDYFSKKIKKRTLKENIIDSNALEISSGLLMTKTFNKLIEKQKEIPLKLYKEQNILIYIRYTLETLFNQYQNLDNQNLPFGVWINPIADHNRAFLQDPKIINKLIKDLKKLGFLLRIIEVPSVARANYLLEKLSKKYNKKISFLFIGGHGTKDSVQFSYSGKEYKKSTTLRNNNIFFPSKENKIIKKLSEKIIEENAQITLISCSTGKNQGIGQKLSKIFSRKIVAPDESTSIKEIRPYFDENKEIRFEIKYRKKVKKTYLKGQEQN